MLTNPHSFSVMPEKISSGSHLITGRVPALMPIEIMAR